MACTFICPLAPFSSGTDWIKTERHGSAMDSFHYVGFQNRCIQPLCHLLQKAALRGSVRDPPGGACISLIAASALWEKKMLNVLLTLKLMVNLCFQIMGLSPEGRLVISQSDSFSPRLRRGTSYLRFNNNWVIFNWNYAYQKHFFFFTSAPPRKESSFPPLIFMDICWSLLKQPSPRGGAYASYQEGEQISDCS